MRILIYSDDGTIDTFDNNSEMAESGKVFHGTATNNGVFYDGDLFPTQANEELLQHINIFLMGAKK